MKIAAVNLENPENPENSIIIVTGSKLYNQLSRCLNKPDKIILAEELNALFSISARNIGATLLLDLSKFNDDVEHPAIKTIFKKCFEQRIIVFTSEQEQVNLYKLFEQGARGFCHTTINDQLLIKAIKSVEDGELWIGRKLIGYLMSKLFLDRAKASVQSLTDCDLTPRESEVIDCIAQGKCDKVIARDLGISPNTVKNHLSHIFAKLQISDRFQLALIYHGINVN